MAILYNFQTKTWENIPGEKVQEAIAAGSHTFAKGAKVPVVSPEGERMEIVPEDARPALHAGYRYVTGEERDVERFQQVAKEMDPLGLNQAAYETVNAALAGTVNVAMNAVDESGDARKFLNAARAAHPGMSTVGSIAGSIALGRYTGLAKWASGVGKGAAAAQKLAGTSLAKQAIQSAAEFGVAGAIEGAAFGATNLISEAGIGNIDLAAEGVSGALSEVGSHVLGGALLGGVAGGVLGAGGRLAKESAVKIKDALGKPMNEALGTIAEQRAVKGIGASKVDLKNLRRMAKESGQSEEAVLKRVGRDLLEYKDAKGNPIMRAAEGKGAQLERITAAKKEVGKKLGEIRKKAYGYIDENPHLRPDARKLMDDLDEKVLKPLRESFDPENVKKGAAVAERLKNIRSRVKAGKEVKMAELDELRQGIRKTLKPPKKGPGVVTQSPHHVELSEADDVLKKFIEDHTEKVALDLGDEALHGALLKNKRLYNSFNIAENIAEGFAEKGGGPIIGMKDLLTLGLVGTPGGFIAGGGAVVARKAWAAFGDNLVANVADRASKMAIVKAAAENVQKVIHGSVDSFLSRTSIAGKVGAKVATRARSMDVVMNTTFDPAMKQAKAATQSEAVKNRIEELRYLQSNPEHLANMLAVRTAGLEDVAPETSAKVAAKEVQKINYLLKHAPKGTMKEGKAESLQPLLDKPEISKTEAASWSRRYAAVVDPDSIMRELAEGTLSPEAADVLKEIWPERRRVALQHLTEKLAGRAERLPYGDLVTLSLVFDTPLHDTMKPDFIARSQQMYAGGPQAGQAAGGHRIQGLAKLTVGERTGSRSETLERGLV